MQGNKTGNTYESCPYFKTVDTTPYHGDVFDHPIYTYFCTKSESRKEIKFPYIQCRKCLNKKQDW